MKNFEYVKALQNSFLALVYPPYCLHCHAGLFDPSHPLCTDCLRLLELIQPIERCMLCFCLIEETDHGICPSCSREQVVLTRTAAVFDYLGPAATLVKKFKYGNQPHLSVGLGAYLAAQFLQLQWPMPDVIVPVPLSFTHWLKRGYNQSLLLADSLSGLLQCPVKDVLKRYSGDFSQAGLDQEQRQRLDGSTIVLKDSKALKGQCVLLIDDVITTGSTLKRCAEALQEGEPASIYALGVCRS